MAKIKLKKGDVVILNSGTEKGKKGKVLSVDVQNDKIVIEGINVRTMHSKAKKQGQESGIIKREKPINVSKANFYCEKCDRGVKLGIKVEKDKTKTRFCKKCNEVK